MLRLQSHSLFFLENNYAIQFWDFLCSTEVRVPGLWSSDRYMLFSSLWRTPLLSTLVGLNTSMSSFNWTSLLGQLVGWLVCVCTDSRTDSHTHIFVLWFVTVFVIVNTDHILYPRPACNSLYNLTWPQIHSNLLATKQGEQAWTITSGFQHLVVTKETTAVCDVWEPFAGRELPPASCE